MADDGRRIYTKLGDDGSTGLLFGGRVAKSDPLVDAAGTLDETVSVLGVARALVSAAELQDIILRIQRNLFVVAADLMANPRGRHRLEAGISLVTPAMVGWLEETIDVLVARRPLANTFIVPGTSVASAVVDVARGVSRRAERSVCRLVADGRVPNPELPVYLNRLSDLLFVLARGAADESAELTSHE